MDAGDVRGASAYKRRVEPSAQELEPRLSKLPVRDRHFLLYNAWIEHPKVPENRKRAAAELRAFSDTGLPDLGPKPLFCELCDEVVARFAELAARPDLSAAEKQRLSAIVLEWAKKEAGKNAWYNIAGKMRDMAGKIVALRGPGSDAAAAAFYMLAFQVGDKTALLPAARLAEKEGCATALPAYTALQNLNEGELHAFGIRDAERKEIDAAVKRCGGSPSPTPTPAAITAPSGTPTPAPRRSR